MRLVSIPKEKYSDYRLSVIFDGYKWDPQFLDRNTVAKQVLVLTEAEHQQLEQYVEALSQETMRAEEYINQHLELTKPLLLSRKIKKDIRNMQNYERDHHVRLMRFDFHPTTANGWAISEVNSDVPGGFAESSLMPAIACEQFPSQEFWFKSFGETLMTALMKKVVPGGKIMFVHCTSYSDDRQVMQYLGDQLTSRGYTAIYGAADHVNFSNHQAYSILNGYEGAIDAIVRFTPLEWLVDVKPKRWQGYFNTVTPSCNHPIALFSQSKRFPLIWDQLELQGISLPTWRLLLPKTVRAKDVSKISNSIYKPVWGRVGEGISIEEACRDDEYAKILKEVRWHPHRYIAQEKFNSQPVMSDEKIPYHVCLGAYSVDGKAAGYYGRISTTPRIDSNAADIAVVIERGTHER